MPQHLSHPGKVKLLNQERVSGLRNIFEEREGETTEDLFFWDAEISNDLVDSHFTHMAESTLKNYAADAQKGVAFLRGHNFTELPIGYSIKGELTEGDGRKKVIASFYTVKGLRETDDLIARMRTGLLRDVSVGFHGGQTICDICGEEFWDCRHFPGLKYEEKKGDTVTTKLATFTIEDAKLSEVSGVFDGSTPEAMILKAQRAAKAGELTHQQVGLLERRYRINLPEPVAFAVPTILEERTAGMTEEEVVKVRTTLGAKNDAEIVTRAEEITRQLTEAKERITALEPQAAEGQQYRSDLIAEALEEGVRAQGADFDNTIYSETLRGLPLAAIKRMRDDWKRIANQQFTTGRSTTEGENNGRPTPTSSVVPDEAYR